MKRCSTAQLRDKEIINLCDGMRLGYADELEIDIGDGRITALLLGDRRGMFCLSKCEDLRIPWERIECIGEDTILVKINANDPPYCEFFKKNERKHKII